MTIFIVIIAIWAVSFIAGLIICKCIALSNRDHCEICFEGKELLSLRNGGLICEPCRSTMDRMFGQVTGR